MKAALLRYNKFVQALLVGVAVALFAHIGLNIPRAVVEDTVATGLEQVLSGGEVAGESVASATDSPATVEKVIDGDTIIVRDAAGKAVTVRLIGIDTPEVEGLPAGAECYGAEASAAAHSLLPVGATVTLTTDNTQATYDKYNRLLAYVTIADGRDVGEWLIREGYAYEYTYAATYKNQNRYRVAEVNAQAERVGLWDACL
ncbi:thermonuclease family protein [Candidatus Kaiserbacteria bacterium]|nr:thermonuclease family protein [Candidatus Kaiserbacteria bacterium]